MRRLAIALLVIASFRDGRAQSTASFFGKRVARVEYSPSKQPIDEVDLKADQLVKAGAILRASDVAQSIDRLFASGYYLDIQVDAEMSGDEVVVRFITKATTFVGHVDITGKIKSPPNAGQIYSALQMTAGRPFEEQMLSNAETSIAKLLRDNGLFEGTIKISHSLDIDTEQVNVTIGVDSGRRAKYQTPIIHGDARLPLQTIIRATGWRLRFIKRWRQMTASLTQNGIGGIQKKYQQQDRLTATVTLDSLDYDPGIRRVTPTLTLEAGPKVKVQALEAKVSKSRLRRYIPVYEEGSVDRDLLTEGARNLRDYFQSKGYPDVDVTFRERRAGPDQDVIEYFIAKGQKKKLVHLAFEGNTYFRDDTLIERMFLRPSSLQVWHGRYSEGFRSKDEDAITNLYKANGFRDVKVKSFVTNNYRGKPNHIAVTFRIVEGPQWTVASLDLKGVHRIDAESLRSRMSMGAGQPYSDLNIAADRNAILTFYSVAGFSKTAFQYSATPAKQPHEVLITYSINEGPQEFVRDVLLMGLYHTRKDVVASRISVKPGDPLSQATLSEGQRRLYNLGIFSRIDAGIQDPDGDAIQKYVFYDFDEASRYNMNIGFGADIARFGPTSENFSSPSGSTGFSPRVSYDISRINFMGTDHTLSLKTLLSNLEQRAALSYADPNFLGVDSQTFTVTGLYDNARNIQTYSSRREEASVELARRLSKPTRISFQFAYRRVSTGNVVIPSLLVPQLLQSVRIGIFTVNLSQDRRDNAADAHKGIYNTLSVGIASNYLGSQRSFLKTLGRNATYTRIGSKFVFARQTTFGVIMPFNYPVGLGPINAVPLPERFVGGGSTSDRGFPENQAGPRDIGVEGTNGSIGQATGFPLGGNAVLFNNFELRFPLIGQNISGVLFEDAGNIYQTLNDVSFSYHQKNLEDFNYMVQAVGFGIRYKTPVGPIRLDLAYALNPPSFNGFNGTYNQLLQCNPNLPPSQLPPFCTPVEQSTGHVQFFFSIGQTF
ncbi:MAG: POTRA domain-containing protein [Bryobacteraceae bacterium]